MLTINNNAARILFIIKPIRYELCSAAEIAQVGAKVGANGDLNVTRFGISCGWWLIMNYYSILGRRVVIIDNDVSAFIFCCGGCCEMIMIRLSVRISTRAQSTLRRRVRPNDICAV